MAGGLMAYLLVLLLRVRPVPPQQPRSKSNGQSNTKSMCALGRIRVAHLSAAGPKELESSLGVESIVPVSCAQRSALNAWYSAVGVLCQPKMPTITAVPSFVRTHGLTHGMSAPAHLSIAETLLGASCSRQEEQSWQRQKCM